jgi:uncharacterized protein (DUF1015 family)
VADVAPFSCRRPIPRLASEVAALPYDTFSRDEAAQEVSRHPHSFLRIDKSAALLPNTVGEYDPQVYTRAHELLDQDEAAGVYIQDPIPCYYAYRLIKDVGSPHQHAQTGIVACVSIDDYLNNVVKRHENTRANKEQDRVDHITALGAQTGPVFLAYRSQPAIDDAVGQATATAPLYDFTAADGVQHTVWRIDSAPAIARIQQAFAALDRIYIADGHHRAAAAVAIGLHNRAATAAPQPSDHFLAVLFPSNQLRILDYNRVVFDLNGLAPQAFLAQVAEKFALTPAPHSPYRPTKKGDYGMYLGTSVPSSVAQDAEPLCTKPSPSNPGPEQQASTLSPGTWYQLTIRDEYRTSDPVRGLDVALLQDNVLGPILGIDDPRTSSRIAYVGGVRGLGELERRAQCEDPGPAVAFALYPSSLDELFAVADAGALMPPKSTWFEPKPRSGLFIHSIQEDIGQPLSPP